MYRMVDCGTWDDPWFESLEPQGKLFFLYLLTNPRSTSCGAFEITPRKMAFETGIPQAQIEGWLGSWAPRVQWWPEHQIVFLKNFYRRQGNQNEKTRTNAVRIVSGLPIQVQRAIGEAYPELATLVDTPAIPDTNPMHQTENEKENEKENETENEEEAENENENEGAVAPRAVVYSQVFEEFWTEWSTGTTKGRGSKKLTYEQWKRWGFDKAGANRGPIMAGLADWKACDQWQREGGRYVKHAERWIRDRGWEDDPPGSEKNSDILPNPHAEAKDRVGYYVELIERIRSGTSNLDPAKLASPAREALEDIGGISAWNPREFASAYRARA